MARDKSQEPKSEAGVEVDTGDAVQSTAFSPSTPVEPGGTNSIHSRHGRGGQYVAVGGGRVVPASEV